MDAVCSHCMLSLHELGIPPLTGMFMQEEFIKKLAERSCQFADKGDGHAVTATYKDICVYWLLSNLPAS